MNWERLQQIKHRVSKNQSAPDMPDMARELIEALEQHVKPKPALNDIGTTEFVIKPVVDQSAADEHRKTPAAGLVPAVEEHVEAEHGKKKGGKK